MGYLNIVTYIPVLGRHECLEIFAKNIYSNVVAVVSNKEDKEFCEKKQWHVVEHANTPLGAKLNFGLKRCLDLNPDVIICTGSDDVMSEETFAVAMFWMHYYDIVCFQDGYFYDLKKQNLYYWPGYTGEHAGKSIGMFRCYQAKVIKDLNGNLWDDSKHKRLDGGAWNKTMKYNKKMLHCKRDELFICDIKDGNGITKIDHFTQNKEDKSLIMNNILF